MNTTNEEIFVRIVRDLFFVYIADKKIIAGRLSSFFRQNKTLDKKLLFPSQSYG